MCIILDINESSEIHNVINIFNCINFSLHTGRSDNLLHSDLNYLFVYELVYFIKNKLVYVTIKKLSCKSLKNFSSVNSSITLAQVTDI